MLYRVVLQGPPAGDENAAQVQREFMRVTALPEHVTAQLFAQMPQVLKRGLHEADAERIAQTLRAIGAVAAVEREATIRAGVFDPTTITPVAPPAAVVSSPAPATPVARWRSHRVVLWMAGAAMTVAVATVFAPAFDPWLSALRPTAGPSVPAVALKRAGTPVPKEAPVFNPTFAHGPWRCTDQRTGTTTYWRYAEGGLLAYLGNEIAHGDRPIGGPDLPETWSITPEQLTWRFATKPPQNFKLVNLSFVHLDYAIGAGHETHCIRP